MTRQSAGRPARQREPQHSGKGAPGGSRTRGFTLLELVVAFTIMGLMASVVFSSFRMVLNSYEKSQERLDLQARRRVLQDQIKRQIGSLFPVRPSGSFLESQEGQSAAQTPLQALSQYPLFYGTPEAVTFVTVAPLMLMENPGLTVVRYGLAQDEWGRHYLGAMETRYQGLGSFIQMVDIPRGKPLPLVDSVFELEFAYYGYDPDSESYRWFGFWSGEDMRGVPEAIRIRYDERHLVVSCNAAFSGGRAGGAVPGRIQRMIRQR